MCLQILLKSVLIITIVIVAMIGMMVPSALAESDYSKIKVKDATTQILEFDKYKVIRTSLTIENDDSEKFRTYYTYLTADDTIHYETSSSYDIDEIGDKTCPNNSIEINPGLEEDFIFCFQVPKSFSNNFKLKFMSSSEDWCADISTNQYIDPCQESTYPLSQISNPTKISYDSLLKTYVNDFENMDANVSNVELISGDDVNLLVMTLSISNKGNTELNGYSIDITARTLSGLEFDTSYYFSMDCDSSIDDINPGLTKTSMLCFEVPKNETAFNLILRSDFGYDNSISNCDNNYNDCNELFINIIAPEPIVEPTPEPIVEPTPEPIVEPTPEPIVEPTPNQQNLASFVDTSKDPQSYVDRYNNEESYKKWFDDNYSQYSSIYEAVGLEEPLGIASFVDETKDPQSYVDRYNNEESYKKWFDDNYSQYSSIYEAVGLSESVMANDVSCGTGTYFKNGICVVDTAKQIDGNARKGGGCLIATATYGSEMATEVQQLRELRDNTLLQTTSGTSFMNTFNDVYYSFSPIIADYERENPMFKEMVKVAITPMISSLSLMENAESESEVLGLGLSVIALNLGMYLGVPAIVVMGIRKHKII